MSKLTINLGTSGQVSGDTIRTAFDKANQNFDMVFGYLTATNYTFSHSQQVVSFSNGTQSYTSYFGSYLGPGGFFILVRFNIEGENPYYGAGYARLYHGSTLLKTFNVTSQNFSQTYTAWCVSSLGSSNRLRMSIETRTNEAIQLENPEIFIIRLG